MGTLLLSLCSGLFGAWLSDWFSRERQVWERSRRSVATLRAISYEFSTIAGLFEAVGRKYIRPEDDGKPIESTFEIKEAYFIIYRANASAIGEVKDTNLAKAVVEIATLGQFFIDDMRMHTAIYEDRDGVNRMQRLIYSSNMLRAKYTIIRTTLPSVLQRIEGYCKLEEERQASWRIPICDACGPK